MAKQAGALFAAAGTGGARRCDLGRGAFSVVRYGRTVVKNKTQSQWPEYAVKVISLETIQKNNYVHQVNQEIGILKHLSHPNICRLVSAFRWRDGAYLVLEYCSQGDLHSYVLNQGALSAMASFLFTAGEIVAGLTAVHEQGFAFGDMKPENVVITASGHCKLTDFGGARALTEDAQAKLQGELESASGMHVAGLRRGEHASELQRGGAEKAAPSRNASAETDHDLATSIWEAQGKAPAGVDGVAGLLTCSAPPSEHQQLGQEAASEQQAEVTDKKMTFEGTGAYMAPELVLQRGRTPNAQSDAWALGCTLFFLRTSRLPFWAATEDEMVDALARFCSAGDISHAEVGDAASRGGGLSFSDEQGSKRDALRRLAQTCADSEDKDREGLLSFVAALFKEDPDERAKVVEVAHDSTNWLNSSVPGKSCLNLYKQPRGLLRNGNAFAASSSSGGAEGGDADPWAKRQFSKIWTVMASEVEMGAAGGFGSVRQGLVAGTSPGGAAGQLVNSDDEWLSEDDVPVTSNPDLLVLNPSGRRLVPATLLFKLPKTWTLFFDAQRKGKNYNAGIAQVIGNITSVQEFWRYWNNINFGFGDRGSLGLFREGIRPVWEDPENKEGGRWIIATNPAVPLDAKKRLDLFTDLALGMIGGHFDGLLDQVNGDGVCGVVFSGAVKGRPKIELWNKKANHDNLVKVDYKIRSLLGLENSNYGVKIEYKSHFGSLKRTMKRAWSSTAAVGGGNTAAAANRDFLAKRCDAEGEGERGGENEREALLAGAKSFSASAAIATKASAEVRYCDWNGGDRASVRAPLCVQHKPAK
eukprot:g1159.t1